MQKKIAPIPPKFGIWDWENMTLAEQHNEIQWKRLKYKKWEYFEAVKHPSILHFAWSKPFWRMNTSFSKKWWAYAKLTGYYYEIYNKSPIPKSILKKMNIASKSRM